MTERIRTGNRIKARLRHFGLLLHTDDRVMSERL